MVIYVHNSILVEDRKSTMPSKDNICAYIDIYIERERDDNVGSTIRYI